MTHVLASFQRNWDTYGFAVFTDAEWDKARDAIHNQTDFSFGTNEGWEEEEQGDILDSISTQAITEDEYETLKRLFPELIRNTQTITYDHLGEQRTFTYTSGGSFGIFPKGVEGEDEE